METNITTWCQIINQLFILENRTRNLGDTDFYQRRFERIKELLKDLQIYVHDPLGEIYDPTRTDCEAILQGDLHPPLKVVEVIKPIIYFTNGDSRRLVQPGVVLIQGQSI